MNTTANRTDFLASPSGIEVTEYPVNHMTSYQAHHLYCSDYATRMAYISLMAGRDSIRATSLLCVA